MGCYPIDYSTYLEPKGFPWCIFAKKTQTMTEEITLKVGEMVKRPSSMNEQERDAWHQQIAQQAKDYLFSIGQPLVYEREGHIVAEHQDGRILIIR